MLHSLDSRQSRKKINRNMGCIEIRKKDRKRWNAMINRNMGCIEMSESAIMANDVPR